MPNFQESKPVNNNFAMYAMNYIAGDCLMCNCCPHVARPRYVYSLPVVMWYMRHLVVYGFSDGQWIIFLSLTQKHENLDIKLIGK